MTRQPSAARACAAGAAIALTLASATTAVATRPSLPRLSDLGVDGATVSFRQPDGSATTIDVRTGTVLQRGGDLHQGWPPPRECSVELGGTCPFVSGVLVVRQDAGQMVLEGGTGAAGWKAVRNDYRSNTLKRVVEVDGKLLMDSASFGIATLEGVDMASGKSLWIYAYPSPMTLGVSPSGPHTEAVAGARQALREFEEYASQGPLGTVDAATAYASQPYGGTVVIDPDPLTASLVRKRVLRGWGALVILAGLAMVFLRLSAGRKRSLLLVLVSAALGLLVVAAGHIAGALTAGLWGGFLLTFIAAHGRGEGRASLLGSCLAAIVCTFALGAGAFLAFGSLLAFFIRRSNDGLLFAGVGIAFVAGLIVIQATRRRQDQPSPLVLWMIMTATASLFFLPWVASALIR